MHVCQHCAKISNLPILTQKPDEKQTWHLVNVYIAIFQLWSGKQVNYPLFSNGCHLLIAYHPLSIDAWKSYNTSNVLHLKENKVWCYNSGRRGRALEIWDHRDRCEYLLTLALPHSLTDPCVCSGSGAWKKICVRVPRVGCECDRPVKISTGVAFQQLSVYIRHPFWALDKRIGGTRSAFGIQ